MVLNLGLPDLSGMDVLRSVRGWSRLPVVVLSARSDSADKVEALDAARRRNAPDLPPVVAGDLVVDLDQRRVTRAGTLVHLTPKEWALLEALVRAGGRVVPREELLHEVWGAAYGREGNYLRTFLGTLRKKLEADPARPRHLLTEPGVGYRFVSDAPLA